MKNIFILLLLLCCFMTCKAPRQIVDSRQTEIRDKSRIDITQSHVAQEQSAGTVSVTVAEDETVVEEWRRVDYDTSQPVDSITGRPPVQSETSGKKTTAKGKQTLAEAVKHSTATVQDGFDDQSALDREEVVEITHSEIPKYPVWKYVFYTVFILALLAAAYFLNKKLGWLRLF